MHCGYDCPCCSGSMAGEFCELKIAMLGYSHFHEINECEVDGGYDGGYDGNVFWDRWSGAYSDGTAGFYQGDACQFNTTKDRKSVV